MVNGGIAVSKDVARKKGTEQDQSQPPPVTMMLKNIPNDLAHDGLSCLLDERGLVGQYDLISIPGDYLSGCNRGYAFINFTSPEAYQHAADHFHGTMLPGSASQKILEVVAAAAQGREALQKRQGLQAKGRRNTRRRPPPGLTSRAPEVRAPVSYGSQMETQQQQMPQYGLCS
eukprot:CAMPEP_0204317322 /NCGR_PEP_ID=MMETSP0469-20131031/5904_1 /ASSEMBLY_ACC=CAM_ASM_000384 /TAXON_ID=2969 /ORGANISM="Oxyrrhis marina" /LENGTH=172 /DNA_ID=CAMNT_0051298227 /DNA_START=42 /DNA_END=560 /DNA_ORIENTATION=+